MCRPVAIIGAGIAGLTAAVTLRRLSIPCFILESNTPTGILRDLHLQFPDDACGACRLARGLTTSCIRINPEIKDVPIITLADVVGLDGAPPRMVLRFRSGQKKEKREVSALIVATGGEPTPSPPHLKSVNPERVLSLYEAEKLFWEGEPPKGKVAFALCAGSRTVEYPVCGAFCCLASIRLAGWLADSGSEVTVFAMDIRAPQPEDWFYAKRHLQRVRLVRCRINRIEPAGARLLLGWEEDGRVLFEEFDYLICATPQKPNSGVLRRLGVGVNRFGFAERFPETNRMGVFVCGYVGFPCTIKEAVESGTAAAMRAAALIKQKPKTSRPPKVALIGSCRQNGIPYNAQLLREILAQFGVESDIFDEKPEFKRVVGGIVANGTLFGAVVLGYKVSLFTPPAHTKAVPLSEADESLQGDVVFVLCTEAFQNGNLCGMTCCRRALDLAVRLKRSSPSRKVVVLTKEVMVRGLDEVLFDTARRMGVLVVRYPHNRKLEVNKGRGKWRVRFYDPAIGRKQTIMADTVVYGDWWHFERIGWSFRDLKYTSRHLGGGFVAAEGEPWAVAGEVLAVLGGRFGAKVNISRRRCSACGRCVQVCPQQALWIQNGRLIFDETLCFGCGGCVAACPAGAISLLESEDAYCGVSV